ncbi:MAG: hypothetical protein ACTSVD_03430 [Candidatus Thorarchaeota archaeon]
MAQRNRESREMFLIMTIIVSYFPLFTCIILLLGVMYFLYRKHWMEDTSRFWMRSLATLSIIILCSLSNVILLTFPVLHGIVFVNSLLELMMWIWPDLLVIAIVAVDIIRTSGLHSLRE